MCRAEKTGARRALATLLLAGTAFGAAAAESSTAASLRPTGPVTINADRAEWEKGGTMVYSGKVKLDSGDLKLAGDRLQLKQFEDGQFEAIVDGAPAALDHAGLPAAQGEARPPVSARAKRLTYDSRNEIVEVNGDALLTRGSDEIRGQKIRYDVARRRIEAAGGEGGQVKIVIQPPPRKSGAPSASTPARKP